MAITEQHGRFLEIPGLPLSLKGHLEAQGSIFRICRDLLHDSPNGLFCSVLCVRVRVVAVTKYFRAVSFVTVYIAQCAGGVFHYVIYSQMQGQQK